MGAGNNVGSHNLCQLASGSCTGIDGSPDGSNIAPHHDGD
jgi:hypothetical protein